MKTPEEGWETREEVGQNREGKSLERKVSTHG